MSADPSFPHATGGLDNSIAEVLVLLFKLPESTIESISAAMQHSGSSFADAALQTGLVTRAELDAAQEWLAQERAIRSRSIFEEALRRQSAHHELVVAPEEWVDPGPQLLIAHNPDSSRSETLRTLRTELLMRTNGLRAAGVFALISPGAQDGRSQLCAELSLAFAQLGGRTLLVDADLRRPHQHVLFGANNETGLTQALIAGTAPRLQRVRGPAAMSLLTSGAPPPNPLELLSGRRFEQLMADWRRDFEYIVLDTPPASQYADGLAVASIGVNVVVLARAARTSFDVLDDLRRKLETTRSQVIGAVINRF